MEYAEILGDNIRFFRKKRGLTYKACVRRLNGMGRKITLKRFILIEKGEKTPTPEELDALELILELRRGTFMAGILRNEPLHGFSEKGIIPLNK